MDMVLTGLTMDAAEAERANLVSRVAPVNKLIAEALKIAGDDRRIVTCRNSALAKQAVNRAQSNT